MARPKFSNETRTQRGGEEEEVLAGSAPSSAKRRKQLSVSVKIRPLTCASQSSLAEPRRCSVWTSSKASPRTRTCSARTQESTRRLAQASNSAGAG